MTPHNEYQVKFEATMKKIRSLLAILLLPVFLGTLAGCQAGGSLQNAATTEGGAGATPAPTETPQKVLSICMGVEPDSLYIYKGSGHSMWGVLEAIYDGPIDMVNYTPQPVILESIPSLENSGASLQPVPVKAGQVVVDVEGDAVLLQQGVRVLPSGCKSLDCAIAWDGTTALSMDRMIGNFILVQGVQWSDGVALTADDSVYSFDMAGDPATPGAKTAYNQTETYQALDARTVQWIGRPGFLTDHLENFFWIPLPKHVLQNYSAAELQTAAETNTLPIGWGAYRIDEWVPGDHIRMVRNPYYFRATEDLPKFDVIVYRFVGNDADSNLMALQNGECDVIDQSVAWDTDYPAVKQLELNGGATVYTALGPEWEHLDFGIKPASYDDGYNPFSVDRPDFFSDARVRQAFAYCIDRQQIVETLLAGLTEVPLSYLPPSHPFYVQGLAEYPYDPAQGESLLEQAGWRDQDGDPSTPRTATGISDVIDGMPFSVTLMTGQAPIRQASAMRIATDLKVCGIQVDVQALPRDQFYAAAPDGILFGRQYDLAEFAWAAGMVPPCFIFESSEIPSAANDWAGQKYGGVNTMGYSSEVLDAACQAALASGADDITQKTGQATAQRIAAQELPSIPLFYFVNIAVSNKDVCGMGMDASARSEFWNIEAMDMGAGCLTGH
jgi:peptide/nickel transport system substrate-binding protein